MPSLEDVEMSNSSSSEIREVDMEDANSSSEQGAADDRQPEVTSDGHVTPEEVNGKNDDDEPKPTSEEQEIARTSSNGNHVDSSIEQDGSQSPGTADKEMASPAAGARRSGEENNAVPSKVQNNVETHYEPPPAVQSIRLDKEVARLNEVLAEVSPEAAQKVLKEKWRMFLFEDYNEAHIAFILRAGLKNSNQEIFDRVLKDEGGFKEVLVKTVMKRPDYIERVLKKTSADIIMASLPESTLNYVMAERFKTVPGKTLIRWLAQAKRLGYNANDILNEDESVSPALLSRESSVELLGSIPVSYAPAPYHSQYKPSQPLPQNHPYPYPPPPPHRAHPQSYSHPPPRPTYQPQPGTQLAPPYSDPLLREQERQATLNNQQAQDVQAARARYAQSSQNRNLGPTATAAKVRQEQAVRSTTGVPTGPLMCTLCQRSFPPGSFDGYTYHITKKVCEKAHPPGGFKWTCPNCLSGFTTKQGLDYHSLRKVCNDGDNIAPATPPMPAPGTTSAPTLPSLSQALMQAAGPPPHMQAPPQRMGQTPSSQAPIRQPGVSAQAAMQISRADVVTPHRGPGRPKKEDIRHSPSELSPDKLAAMEQAIRDAETETAQKIAALSSSNYTEEERQRRITSLTNAIATKKSGIRKSFGVSLRMREKDKQARVAAGIGLSTGTSRIREFNASSSVSPRVSPPTTSFSPINANNNNSSRPVLPPNGYTGPSAQGPYRTPHYDPAPRSNGRDSPLRAAQLNDGAPSSGFGMLKASGSSPYPAYCPLSVNNKRKRDSQEPIRPGGAGSSRNGTPQMSMMMEVSAEDAASKFAKGYQKKKADREREDREKGTGTGRDVSMEDAPASEPKERISIDLSSDSEDVELPVVKSVERDVDENGEKNGEENGKENGEENGTEERRPIGAGMARRGDDDESPEAAAAAEDGPVDKLTVGEHVQAEEH